MSWVLSGVLMLGASVSAVAATTLEQRRQEALFLSAVAAGDIDALTDIAESLADGPARTDLLSRALFQTIEALDSGSTESAGECATFAALIALGADPRARDSDGRTPLMLAVAECWLCGVQELLAAAAPVDVVDRGGSTPLHFVSDLECRGSLEIARLLLGHGARTDVADEKGFAPLLDATFRNDEMVGLLLAAGADPDIPDRAGRTPLEAAARGGDLEKVRILLDAGASPTAGSAVEAICGKSSEIIELLLSAEPKIEPSGSTTATAVICAAEKGPPLLERILAAGATIDAVDSEGSTALLDAVLWGKLEVVKQLVAFGADVNRADHRGWTPYLAAVALEKQSILELLQRRGVNHNGEQELALLRAVKSGDHAAAGRLLSGGADANFSDLVGTPLLSEASFNNDLEMVHLLLAYGADPTGYLTPRYPPLAAAVKAENLEIIDLLLSTGARASIRDAPGAEAMARAALIANPEVVGRLLEAGADPAGCDTEGRCPLYLAAGKGHRDGYLCGLMFSVLERHQTEDYALTADLLLSAGADPEVIYEGETALDNAIAFNNKHLIRALLDSGISGEALRWPTQTPLMVAARHHAVRAVRRLLAAGAKIEERDRYGRTALHHATRADFLHASGPLTIEALLEAGVEVNAPDLDGWLPLHNLLRGWPVEETWPEEYLILVDEEETERDAQDRRLRIEAARLLIAAGALIDEPATNGITPRSLIAAIGDSELMAMLE